MPLKSIFAYTWQVQKTHVYYCSTRVKTGWHYHCFVDLILNCPYLDPDTLDDGIMFSPILIYYYFSTVIVIYNCTFSTMQFTIF